MTYIPKVWHLFPNQSDLWNRTHNSYCRSTVQIQTVSHRDGGRHPRLKLVGFFFKWEIVSPRICHSSFAFSLPCPLTIPCYRFDIQDHHLQHPNGFPNVFVETLNAASELGLRIKRHTASVRKHTHFNSQWWWISSCRAEATLFMKQLSNT